MGVLRTIGLIFLGLFILFIIFIIAVILINRPGTPSPNLHIIINNETIPMPKTPTLVTNLPIGISYTGPPTTAIAGYYCVYNATVANDGWLVNGTTYEPNPQAYHPPGYSIQLNAQLSNGLWVQNAYGATWQGSNILLEEEVWNGQNILSGMVGPLGQPCGWLVISIENGTAYFGYSSDGVNINWYASYPVGNATIQPGFRTNIVIAGPGNGAGVNFTSLYAALALWYWNGSAWVPAPIEPGGITAEFVVQAWYYGGDNEVVVSYPQPTSELLALPTPQFTP